jgi:starch synthase
MNQKNLKIAFMASEMIPLAKTGGLADVAGALPKYLSRQPGLELVAFLPFYREVKKKNLRLEPVLEKINLDWPGPEKEFSVFAYQAEGFKIYLIKNDFYFDRDYLYGTPQGDYPDNGERFAFFSLAALQVMKRLGFQPDLIHAHDWQAAIIFAYLKHSYQNDPFFQKTASLFTVHNLAYQGLFPREILSRIGLPEYLFNPEDLEFYGKVNFLKAGLLYATAISTVSPTYSQEIQTPEFGCGLDGVLRKRADWLFGIMNGIDYGEWNPETDPALPMNYSARDWTGKKVCRQVLLSQYQLPMEADQPVVGMVSRLAGQKGFDLLVESLEEIFKRDLLLIILGTGEQKIQELLKQAQQKYRNRLGLKIAFDDQLARLIYAGSDYFLIPSRYEPCGLTQMYSLRYGTIPVVRSTGGLKDSVTEFDPQTLTGHGFRFDRYQTEDLVKALDRALSFYEKEPYWSALKQQTMKADFSWEKSAAAYLELYLKLVKD